MTTELFTLTPNLFSNNPNSNGLGVEALGRQYNIFTDDNFDDVLEHIDMKEEFQNKKVRCAQCDVEINKKNLRAVVPRITGTHDFICNNLVCYHRYMWEHDSNGIL